MAERRVYDPAILKGAEEWVDERCGVELKAIPDELRRAARRQSLIEGRAERVMTQYDIDRR
jgi:hypothetical protein